MLVPRKVPLEEVFGIDVLRHTQAEPRGRVRLAFVGSTKNTYLDTVPDAEGTYWYWIKVTLNDRSAYNLGPVSSAPAKVWTP